MLYTVTRRFYWCEEDVEWKPNPSNLPSESEIEIVREFAPDRTGKSEWRSIEDLQYLYPEHAGQLGGNGSTMFTRRVAKDFLCSPKQAKKKEGNKIVERRFYGLVKEVKGNHAIRSDIKKRVEKMPCAVLGTCSHIEVDHKDGRKDDPRVNNVETQMFSDFQPLHQVVNVVKREACKECKRTNQRFDATSLGYSTSYTEGDSQYEGTCEGCYWFDPRSFRSNV